MEKRTHLYIDRKSPAVWLMALCMTGSAAAGIILFSGTDGTAPWSRVVLPVLAVAVYALIVLLCGDELFYKTAIPVWVLGGCGIWRLAAALPAQPVSLAVSCACIAVVCVCYTAITAGAVKHFWLLPLYLVELAVIVYADTKTPGTLLPEYLMVLGKLILVFSIRVHTDGKFHPTWGDRIDGRRIRSAPALEQIAPYVMVNRNGSNNLFSEAVEITGLERYVRAKRREGLTGFGLSHVIMAAYVRTVAKYPALNRFVAGQKIYSRGEDIVLCMTVKKEMTTASPDTVIKVHLTPRDTAAEVYRKYARQLELAKDEMAKSGVDNTAGAFMIIPGLLIKFVFWLLKTLDYFGLVPRFLLEVSPFHGSVYMTSMGSLGIRPVYHHLYDFGTIPVFCSFGRKRRVEEIEKGEIAERKYMDLKFNLDERICDGFYYAAVMKYFLKVLNHPELMDTPPETVERDIE